MKFSFIGGDIRIASLACGLRQEGHECSCFALENAHTTEGSCSALSLNYCTQDADCVILPLPILNLQGNLNAPLSSRTLAIEEVFSALPKTALIMGGKADKKLLELVEKHGLDFVDYFEREELVVLNALATAEGAIALVLEKSPMTIWESRILIIGNGRIGKMLAERLHALGAKVTVSARKSGDLAQIRCSGCEAVNTQHLGENLGNFDTVINTVPALVLDREKLQKMRNDCLCIDLASKPGGVDFEAARQLDLNVVWALGLPAQTAPITAGRIIKEAVLNILREKRGLL